MAKANAEKEDVIITITCYEELIQTVFGFKSTHTENTLRFSIEWLDYVRVRISRKFIVYLVD